MGRKSVRQKRLLQMILEHGAIPKTSFLSKELGVTERTIQNDLNDIDELIPQVALEDIEQKLMFRLRERLPEMSDLNLIRLAGFFVSKKIETQAKGELKVEYEVVVVDELAETDIEKKDKDKVDTTPRGPESRP